MYLIPRPGSMSDKIDILCASVDNNISRCVRNANLSSLILGLLLSLNYVAVIIRGRARMWNVQTGDSIVACVTKGGSDKSAEVHCPPLESHGCKASYGQHNHGTLAEIQVGGSRSPSIQSRSLSLRLRHFLSPKKDFEGQTIHLGRRCQAVRADLVHILAPGILRDSHPPPCVAVGQVPQQPGSILLTCRCWFLFLGLRLVSFLMSLINKVTT